MNILENSELFSDPVNPDNPDYSSLLGTLEGVYNGTVPMETLVRYHEVLSEKTNLEIAGINAAIAQNPPHVDSLRILASSWQLVSMMLASVRIYIDSPTKENMQSAVSRLIDAMDKINKIRETEF